MLIHVIQKILITINVFVTEAIHAIAARVIHAIVAGVIHASVEKEIPAIAEQLIHATADGEMIVSVVGLIRAMILAQHHMTPAMKIVWTLTHVTQTVRAMIHVLIPIAQTMMSAIVLEVQSSAIHCVRTTTRTVTQNVRATTHVIQKRIVMTHAHVEMQIHATVARATRVIVIGVTHASVVGVIHVNVVPPSRASAM